MNEQIKESYLEVKKEIRHILFYDWNPLDIPNQEYLEEEYDDQIRTIYKAIESGATEKELTDILKKLEIEITGENTLPNDQVQAASKKLTKVAIL